MRDVSSEGFCANNMPGTSNNPIKRKVRKRPPHVVRYSPPKYLRHSRLTQAGNQHIPLLVCRRHRRYSPFAQKCTTPRCAPVEAAVWDRREWSHLRDSRRSQTAATAAKGLTVSTAVSFEEEGCVGAP